MPRSNRAGPGVRATAESVAAGQLIPRDLQNRLFAEIGRRPFRSLAVALGAGYLAGGGLGTILTARLLAVGTRIALRLALVPILADGVERALFPSRETENSDVQHPQSKQGNQKEMNS